MAKIHFFRHAILVGLLSPLLFSACATGPEVPSVAELIGKNTSQDGGACMQTSGVRSYSIYNEEFIFVDASLGSYIVTVYPGCQDLGTTPNIAFEGRINEVCGGSMDKIRTRGQHCNIHQIFEFDTRDAAFSAYQNATVQQGALVEQAADATQGAEE
jgi:hypothetical protein